VRAGNDLVTTIGSGNLSSGGIGGNLELQVAATALGSNRHPIADGIAGFLRELARTKSLRIQPTARRFLEEVTQDIPAGRHVFSSLSRPLIDSIIASSQGNGSASVTLLSPWHAGTGEQIDTSVIGSLRRRISAAIEVLTDGIDGRAPDLPHCRTRIYRGRSDTAVEGDDDSMPQLPSRLHAKSVIIQRADRVWWFLGSANATRPGLCQSVLQGGNLEVMAMLPLASTHHARLDATWSSLFREAGTVHRTRSTWKIAPSGTILGGELMPTSGGMILRLTACSPSIRTAMLLRPSGLRKSPPITIVFRKGEASLTSDQTRWLVPAPPNRLQGATSLILDELYRGKRYPFIVSVPLLFDDNSDVALADRLEEEIRFLEGRWPVPRPSGMTQTLDQDPDAPDMAPDTDQDLDAVTASSHQGKLDRLADLLHRIGRLLGPASCVRQRARWIEICSRDLPPHLRRHVVSLLSRNRP
jgi:hypothetical protein